MHNTSDVRVQETMPLATPDQIKAELPISELASDNVASFINAALNRVERRQEPLELQISVKQSSLALHSIEPGFERKLTLPEGITIVDSDPNASYQIILLPGGTAPRIGIELKNRKGSRRLIRVDPMTGIPRIEMPKETT